MGAANGRSSPAQLKRFAESINLIVVAVTIEGGLGTGNVDMKRIVCPWMVVALLVSGCNRNREIDHAVRVADGNPLMNEAMDNARRSVDRFIAAMQSPQHGQSEFRVKCAFIDGEEVEHIWLDQVTLKENVFCGFVFNDPEYVRNVSAGQFVAVPTKEISDWMYIQDGRLVGGFTLRVLRDALHPKERAAYDQRVPFRVE